MAARIWAVFGGAVVLLVGVPMLWGGAQLVGLGGSAYYLLAGAALALTGALLALRRAAAGWVYALTLLATLVWALGESGLRFWPLFPRLLAPAVLGGFTCLVLMAAPRGPRRGAALTAAGASSLLLVLVLLAALPGTWSQGVAGRPAATSPPPRSAAPAGDWRFYGRDPGGSRFAPYAQITPANVRRLEVAWIAHTGERPNAGSEDQDTPVQVGSTLYACTPTDVVVALSADTGRVLWRHDPHVKPGFWNRCRGVGVYETAAARGAAPGAALAPCDRRIVNTTIDGRMFALDAASGAPCPGFGQGGVVDLKALMGPVAPGFYQPTSMPTVAGDRIIVGGWVTDNLMLGEPSGVVRAFDADTGALVWAWDIGNPAATGARPAGYTYTRGTPNVWSTPAFDPKLGLVYLPTGNATPDYWGSHRSKQTEQYSSSVVAVDLATGRERWAFQTVHHDLWDYDVPAQPLLADFPVGGGRTTPALIQLTKRGQVFVLDRATGKPLVDTVEKPVPGGAQPGEWTSPTQPYSTGMPTLQGERLTESMMWGVSPLDQLGCRLQFRRARYDGDFTPPGHPGRPSLQWPGQGGGQNWGSGAWDPQAGLLITAGVRTPQTVVLTPYTGRPIGGPYKPLASVVRSAGPMAPVDDRPPQSRSAVRYVSRNTPMLGAAFAPCLEPPHGELTAVDLATRKVVWRVPVGTAEMQGPFGLASHLLIPIGTVGLGGPVATAGGLVFHASTTDPYLRAYDSRTGRLLWSGRLPVGVGGTPMTFVSPATGRQYVVVSAGGARLAPGPKGDAVVAFTLPR